MKKLFNIVLFVVAAGSMGWAFYGEKIKDRRNGNFRRRQEKRRREENDENEQNE